MTRSRRPASAALTTVFVLTLTASAPLGAQPRSAASAALSGSGRIDSIFAPYDKADVPGCALGVFRDGAIAYARGYGSADLERHVAISPATLFDVGSTSKQFAAASILLLAQDGKLSLTDDVRRYIPELPSYGTPITIDHLLRHTSGLRDYNGLLALAGHGVEEVTTDSQALAIVVAQRHLNFPPGTKFSYSNTGYFLLSVIVKRVSGKPLAQFARERIFLPLGMTHTLYRNHAAMLIPGRALGYAPDDSSGFRNSMSNWEQTGDGAVHLSVDDALRWDENFYHPRVGGAAMVAALQARGTLSNGDSIPYARGLFVGSYRGVRRVEHGGDWIGYHAAFTRFPGQHTSVVVLCNSDGISPTGLANRVADVVLEGVLSPPAPKAVASAPTGRAPAAAAAATGAGLPLRAIVGRYLTAAEDEVVRVTEKGGAPVLQISGQSFPMTASGPATFALTGVPASVEFLSAPNGAVRALRLHVGDEVRPEAARFAPAVPSRSQLGDYAGSYWSPELDVGWSIAARGDTLVLTNPRQSALVDIGGPMTPTTRDAFEVGGAIIHFTRDGAGKVDGFGLSASRMSGIRFDRR